MCAWNEIGGSTVRNDFFLILFRSCEMCVRHGRVIELLLSYRLKATASAHFVEKPKFITQQDGVRFVCVCVCVKGQTNSHPCDVWIMCVSMSMTFALGALHWSLDSGFNETKWFRKCGRVLHLKSTHIEIIDFLRRHRVKSDGRWALNAVSMWHEMNAFVMVVRMCWTCTPCINKMRTPTCNSS